MFDWIMGFFVVILAAAFTVVCVVGAIVTCAYAWNAIQEDILK